MSATQQKKRNRKEANPLPWVLLVIALVIAAIWFVSRGAKKSPQMAAAAEQTILLLPPPPAPLPPPPPPPENEPPPEEEEMMVQEEVDENEEPPEDPSPEPPSEDLGGGVAGGAGPAIGPGGGGGSRIGGSNRRGSGSKFGWYAAKVQTSIREALARNPSTRSASFSSITVKIWADATGRVTRAHLVGSSGNPAIDQAIRNRILTGLQLPQGPPADLPMPINLRISARKPAI